jgi:hypothetical protein
MGFQRQAERRASSAPRDFQLLGTAANRRSFVAPLSVRGVAPDSYSTIKRTDASTAAADYRRLDGALATAGNLRGDEACGDGVSEQGEQVNRLAGLAIKQKPSVDFSDYWQRSACIN